MPHWLDFLSEDEPEIDPGLEVIEALDAALARDANGVTVQSEIATIRARLLESGSSAEAVDLLEQLLGVVAGERHVAAFEQVSDQSRDMAEKRTA